MTKRKRTLMERAQEYAVGKEWPHIVSFPRDGAVNAWLAGYRAGKREGRATAMEDCGWGAARRSRK